MSAAELEGVGIAMIGVSLSLFARTPVNSTFVVDLLPGGMVGLGADWALAFPVLTQTATIRHIGSTTRSPGSL